MVKITKSEGKMKAQKAMSTPHVRHSAGISNGKGKSFHEVLPFGSGAKRQEKRWGRFGKSSELLNLEMKKEQPSGSIFLSR